MAVPAAASASASVGSAAGLHPRSMGAAGQAPNTGAAVSSVHTYVTSQVASGPQSVAAVTVQTCCLAHNVPVTVPPTALMSSVVSQLSVTVPAAAMASASVGSAAGLHPRSMGVAGQAEKTGALVSTRVIVCAQVSAAASAVHLSKTEYVRVYTFLQGVGSVSTVTDVTVRSAYQSAMEAASIPAGQPSSGMTTPPASMNSAPVA